MTTTSRAVCLNRISMSDLVMVEREVLERAHEALSCCYDVNDWPADGTTRQDAALRLLTSALQSVEGGVQGSIATKQESCPESAPRTETAIVAALRECQRVLAMMIDPDSIKATSVIHAFAAATAAEAKARTVLSGAAKSDGGSSPTDVMPSATVPNDSASLKQHAASGQRVNPACPSDTQLTKTPSADHDDGNLRSLAEPTPRDSSESTTGGAAPDHTTIEERGR